MSPVTIDDAPPPVPRIPRPEVRERLLVAAEREFLESGYRGASLGGIARRAGFTKGAVYSNFDSKQALLAALLGERSARLGRTALGRLAAGGPDGSSADASADASSEAPGGVPGVGDLPQRAGRLLAAEAVADSEWNVLLAELAVHAVGDPAAARSYAALRERQRDELAAALAEYIPGLGLPADTDVRRAAFVLVTLMSALALESAADPRVDRDALADILATVIGSLMGGHR